MKSAAIKAGRELARPQAKIGTPKTEETARFARRNLHSPNGFQGFVKVCTQNNWKRRASRAETVIPLRGFKVFVKIGTPRTEKKGALRAPKPSLPKGFKVSCGNRHPKD